MSLKEGKFKCKGIDCNRNPCRNYALEDSSFCKYHDYMKKYTDEMILNLKLCSGCKKMYYLENSIQCDNCKNRSKKIREDNKKSLTENDFCKYDKCQFKKQDNGYCGKHQRALFKYEVENTGKRVCRDYIRGC